MSEPTEVTDEDLERVVARVRSIRRRELRAKLLGVGLAMFLGGGLFVGSFYVLPERGSTFSDVSGALSSYRRDRSRTTLRLAVAAIGVFTGVVVYRRLSPREHVDDVE